MSQDTSDKAQPRRDPQSGPNRPSRSKPSDDLRSDVLESALGDLMGMSDEELMSSLASMTESGDMPDGEGSGFETDSKSSEEEAAPEADGQSESATDEDEHVEIDAVEAPEAAVDAERESTEEESGRAPVLDDRIKEDPIVLALIKNGVVDVDQASIALRNCEESTELWRALCDVDGVESERVFASVAKTSGYPAYTYLDAAPTRELIDDLAEHLSEEKLIGLLDRGLLPVDLDPASDDANFRLMIVTHDPSEPSIQDHLAAEEISAMCLYAPRKQVINRVETVRSWLDSPFGMGFGFDDAEGPDALPETSESLPEQSTASEDPTHVNYASPGIQDRYSGDGTSHHEPEPIEITDFDGELPIQMEDASDDEVREIPTYDESEDLPSLLQPASRDRVIRSLLQKRLVSKEEVQLGIGEWQKGDAKDALWRVVASVPGVDREAIYQEAATLYAFKQEEIGPGRPDFDFVILTMETVAEDQREELLDLLLLPFEHVVDYETGSGRMVFVTPDPTHPKVSRLLHELDLGRFELRYAPESAIAELLDELFPRKNEYLERISENDENAFDLGTNYEEAVDIVDEDALDAEINRSKLINLFEATLVEATRQGASDVHILPNPKRQIEIHFRLDGRLKKWHLEEGVTPEAFISVVKDNSVNVDRFERDAAQDGFIQRRIDDTLIRFRVSILPIASANQEIRAESIVIRILDDRKVLTELTQLGMLETALARFDQAIRQPHGMVILTGPTGSGKSTTLVAALHQVVTPEVNVLTVEDPVEYIIRGVRQIKLSHKLDLEMALRSILRHDPDIVMVGEMRDQHTAELAIKLANTGHLTFSTLHTNDAPAAVSRLYKMGVEPFLIAYAINLVVAQRLIRTLCPACKTVNENPDEVLMRSLGWTDEQIKETTVYQAGTGTGCKNCNSMGYKGRRAICETLYFTDQVRHLIAESGTDIDEEAIREAGIKDGMLTLRESGKRLVEMGETSVEEMLRVTGAE